jgi:hypothetical protein
MLDFYIFTIASALENLFYTQVWHILHVLVPLPGIEGTAQLSAILSQICTTVEPGQRSSQLRTVSLSLQQTFGYQIRGLQYRGLVLSRSLHSKVPNIYF